MNQAYPANHESGSLLTGQEINGRFTRSLDQRTTTIWDRFTSNHLGLGGSLRQPSQAPKHWGTGGEMAIWISRDQGRHWEMEKQLTRESHFNHTYARRPVNAHPNFYAFWADGNPDQFSESRLYFTDQTGNQVWVLPYEMNQEREEPIPFQP
tara:strand:- start:139 stop:594 length:456 start_codon:yes stop_codon:yes gene_type:complete